MRILYVIHSVGGPSGGCRIVFEHCNRLVARGHEVSLATLDGSMSCGWFPTINFEIIDPVRMPAAARRADVLTATEANTAPIVMNLETDARKYYFVQMRESFFHLMQNPVWAGEVEENYRKAKGILRPIPIGQWLKDFLENEYGYKDLTIVPNGMNTEMFYPDPAFPKKQGIKRVLIEGFSSSEAKDVRMMAFKTVDTYRRGYPGSIEVWGFSQSPCYADFDRYWRWPNQDLIRQLYSSSDVLLKATRYEGRTCLAALEAMACGCAVNIAVGQGDDDLLNSHNCLKVKYGDFDGFLKNFVHLLGNDNFRTGLILNGVRYVKEHLNWDDMIDLLEGVYSK